ncbi:MAG: type I-C CRISPR-associated protein Cas5 [Rhodocyclaceae bacterium]|nr:MAG: type I-C CRISPR-associated protein Cas5 [Rhodocyclaceae bacterium]
MSDPKRTQIEFRTWARYALFTDPVSRVGGEKCSYHIPTYEALKGVAKSIYWKPTLIWVIDEVRVMKPIRTQTKGTKPLNFGGVYPSEKTPGIKQEPFNTLAIYTFLADVEYQVRAHFEWNTCRPELAEDQNEPKHHIIAKRMLERGGRQDIFLGTRDCQGYVEPCAFGSGSGHYDSAGELGYGLTFHGFDYPDETGRKELRTRFWMPKMENGVIRFIRPEACTVTKFIREMEPKDFTLGRSLRAVETEESEG